MSVTYKTTIVVKTNILPLNCYTVHTGRLHFNNHKQVRFNSKWYWKKTQIRFIGSNLPNICSCLETTQ